MTDITERLRKWAAVFEVDWARDLREAADEIERLRAERAGDQQRLFHYESASVGRLDELLIVEQLRKENAELRKQLERKQSALDGGP